MRWVSIRSPTHLYRTAPLAGLWTHQTGGFYHDGRFATLTGVLHHYDRNFKLGLSDPETGDLIAHAHVETESVKGSSRNS